MQLDIVEVTHQPQVLAVVHDAQLTKLLQFCDGGGEAGQLEGSQTHPAPEQEVLVGPLLLPTRQIPDVEHHPQVDFCAHVSQDRKLHLLAAVAMTRNASCATIAADAAFITTRLAFIN